MATDRPRDPAECRHWLGIRPYSPAWTVTWKAFYGTPLDPEERPIWKQVSGHGEERPGVGWFELFANVGRGGGKDDAVKTVVNFECRFGGHEIAAAPGQRIPVVVICPFLRQSSGMLAMVKGEAQLPRLRSAVANITKDAVEYKNGLVAQVQTCDDVAVVGDTVGLAVRNEWALFPDAAAIDANLRPALRQMVGTPPHRLVGISSSYTKEDLAWETFRDHFGRADTDVLVVQGSTELFNPNIDREWLAKEWRRLGERMGAMHFNCEWQDAVQDGWFGDTVGSCIDKDITKRQAQPGIRYIIAIDPAFSMDNFAVSVAHAEKREDGLPLLVQDFCHAWKPRLLGHLAKINADDMAIRIKALCEAYGTHLVYVDQHGGEPLREVFARRGVTLIERPWRATTKAPTFQFIRNAMIAGRVRLLDAPEQTKEFHAIRGELLRSGTERIEAAYGHDDRVSAAVMSLFEASKISGAHAYGNSESYRAARRILRSSWDGGGSAAIDEPTGLPKMTMYPPRDRRRTGTGTGGEGF